MRYQIFISYRREGGEFFVKILHDELTRRGYRVFYDVESMESGAFDAQLYKIIDECEDFILVLPAHALDRCFEEKDWVAEETRYAIRKKKNIIPVMMKNFVWPEKMPEGMEVLPYYEGESFTSNVNEEYVRASVNILCKRLLKSKPDLLKRYRKFLIPAAALLFIGLFVTVYGLKVLKKDPPSAGEETGSASSVPVSETDLPEKDLSDEAETSGTERTEAEETSGTERTETEETSGTERTEAEEPGGPEGYNTESYLHGLFKDYIGQRFENELFFLYEDYDRDGRYEAFGATGETASYEFEGAPCYTDVVLYYADSNGKITEILRSGGGYNGCVPYAADGEMLLDTGTDLYFVWEDYMGGVSSSSWLFSVKDGAVCSPKITSSFMNLHAETDHYEALRDYPEDAHARDIFWFMYDGEKREFFTIARTFKDDADGQVRSLNTAPGLMIQDDSRVNIDYVELVNGKEMERLGTSGAGVDVVIGSGTSIGDFEDQLVGHRVGETFTIDVAVPSDYYLEAIAGSTVTFQITVNGIYV